MQRCISPRDCVSDIANNSVIRSSISTIRFVWIFLVWLSDTCFYIVGPQPAIRWFKIVTSEFWNFYLNLKFAEQEEFIEYSGKDRNSINSISNSITLTLVFFMIMLSCYVLQAFKQFLSITVNCNINKKPLCFIARFFQ